MSTSGESGSGSGARRRRRRKGKAITDDPHLSDEIAGPEPTPLSGPANLTCSGQASSSAHGVAQRQPDIVTGVTSDDQSPVVGNVTASTDKQFARATRKTGYGRAGTEISLKCNYFQVIINPESLDIWEYHVEVTDNSGATLSKGFKRMVMSNASETFTKAFAYDGESLLCTNGPLNATILDRDMPVEIPNYRGDNKAKRTLTVHIKAIGPVDIKGITLNEIRAIENDSKAIQVLRVLHIVLRHHAVTEKKLKPFHDSYFDCADENGAGIMITNYGVVFNRTGFSASLRITSIPTCLALNFDHASTMFYSAMALAQFWVRCGRYMNFELLEKFLKGVRIVTLHTKRRYTISKVMRTTCLDTKFQWTQMSGRGIPQTWNISVADYFREQYGPLRNPNSPALVVGNNPTKPVFMPIEVCEILPGQRYNAKNLSEAQMTDFINYCRLSPREREEQCIKKLEGVDYDNGLLLQQFNVRIDRNMIKVSGRVLVEPQVQIRVVSSNQGRPQGRSMPQPMLSAIERSRNPTASWNYAPTPNFPIKQFSSPVQRELRWVLAFFWGGQSGRDSQFPAKFSEDLQSVCKLRGLTLRNILIVRATMGLQPEAQVDNVLQQLPENVDFVVAILPPKNNPINVKLYATLKEKCETLRGNHGIITQCIVYQEKDGAMTNSIFLTNISLKINLKLGGGNFQVKDLPGVGTPQRKPCTCIFGLDVSHGAAGIADYPSIAAVVASMDSNMLKYSSQVRAQAPGTEIIGKLDEMVLEHLEEFHSCHGSLPTQIIIFRDGVSESQFAEVLQAELTAFKKACKLATAAHPNDLAESSMIKITLIVLQKRHRTRFYGMLPPQRGFNLPPGTVIDRTVTHPLYNDFFLYSHAIQGKAANAMTTRPTYYTVLYDEIEFPPDVLQHLTFYLCYCFGRCTKAVSMPAPAYFAHVAAKHYRCFVPPRNPVNSAQLLSVAEINAINEKFRLHDNLRSHNGVNHKRMFYA